MCLIAILSLALSTTHTQKRPQQIMKIAILHSLAALFMAALATIPPNGPNNFALPRQKA